MIEPAFSALPVELNSQTKTWFEVLKCTKKLWGNMVMRDFSSGVKQLTAKVLTGTETYGKEFPEKSFTR